MPVKTQGMGTSVESSIERVNARQLGEKMHPEHDDNYRTEASD